MPFTPFAVHGLPPGGATAQVLAKLSGASYDTGWATPGPLADRYVLAGLTTSQDYPGGAAGALPLTTLAAAGDDFTVEATDLLINNAGIYQLFLQIGAYATSNAADGNLSLQLTGTWRTGGHNPWGAAAAPAILASFSPSTTAASGQTFYDSITTPALHLPAGVTVNAFLVPFTSVAGLHLVGVDGGGGTVTGVGGVRIA